MLSMRCGARLVMLGAMRSAAIILLCLSLSRSVLAEPAAPITPLQQLTDLRLSIRSDRRVSGFVLLGLGLASVAVGGAIATFGHEQRALLAAGITTASFGAVNAALSFGLLDLSAAQERRIRSARDPHEFAQLREAELIAHLHSGQFFAVNAGLDVFYIASGALLCAIAAVRNQPDRWELGSGVALMVQGALLMAFDIVNWLNSNDRAARFRALHQF
jgi:hypothetical protein